MKKYIFLLSSALLFAMTMQAQKVTNIVYVGTEGVTEDFKSAIAFIVVKKYPGHFERLDYKKAGPLKKRRSFKDSDLKILEGRYFEYRPDGTLIYSGNYLDNKKTGDWNTYNDTGKVIYSARYENDTIAEVHDVDAKRDSAKYDDEREAAFPGKDKAWMKYLVRSLENKETAGKAAKAGHLIVNFIVDVDGTIKEAFLSKSAEYALDEDSLDIILKSPKWHAAWQDGHPVRAYRRQPLTFAQN